VLHAFFVWSQNSWLGTTVHESTWMFPVLEACHLLALCVLAGSLLMVDLRMLGAGLTGRPIAELSADARPWLLGALAMTGVTGLLLFSAEALKLYAIPAFWVKLTALPVALLYTFAVRERVARHPGLETGWRSRGVAAASLALWLAVAGAGRWIGFS
jgi:Family of unknown function (DUF6644)